MMSIEELDKTTPVTPPKVNRKMNPMFHKFKTILFFGDPYMVASQEKTLIPVGIAIIIVAAVKQARESTSIPIVNI